MSDSQRPTHVNDGALDSATGVSGARTRGMRPGGTTLCLEAAPLLVTVKMPCPATAPAAVVGSGDDRFPV
jgi:hypothetical protein